MPYNYLLPTGTIVPDASTVLTDVQGEWRAALGADLNVDPETPQGVLIVAEAQNRIQAAENNAALANQINPDVSGGVFLDALCGLSGVYRAGATRNLVTGVLLTGQPQTLIPAGSRARTANGDLFESVGAVQFDSLGQGSVSFQAVEVGPVAAAANSLTLIVDAVLGWETVNNPNAGVTGKAQQSDESLRNYRRQTLARQAMSVSEAVTGDVYAVPGVRSLQFRENTGASLALIDGILIGGHSVWACVDGGTDADIAAALLQAKTAGAGWTGSVSVNVVDPFSGQAYPVDFERPTDFNVLCRVTVRRGTFVGDIASTVRDAVLAYANGELPGDVGFVVGGDVSPFELAGAITRQVLGIYVQKVEVSATSPIAYQPTEIDLAINEVARITGSSITVIEL